MEDLSLSSKRADIFIIKASLNDCHELDHKYIMFNTTYNTIEIVRVFSICIRDPNFITVFEDATNRHNADWIFSFILVIYNLEHLLHYSKLPKTNCEISWRRCASLNWFIIDSGNDVPLGRFQTTT